MQKLFMRPTRTFASSLTFRNLNHNKFDEEFKLNVRGNSNTHSEIELNNKYMEYVNRIFRWSMFRERSLIQRKDIDENLVEMHKLAEHFGNPQKSMKIIHVAGTNGKGSVTLKTANALQKMGYKTGLFTSPHINSFRERIQIN